jgi:ArsR family transcriptional regulator
MASAVGEAPTAVDRAAELLRVLGTPNRLGIVLELARGSRCVHQLVGALGISQSLASQHLRILRNTGLVNHARRGKETEYSLADARVARIARDALVHSQELAHQPRVALAEPIRPTR